MNRFKLPTLFALFFSILCLEAIGQSFSDPNELLWSCENMSQTELHDIDGDGDLDPIAFSTLDGRFCWYEFDNGVILEQHIVDLGLEHSRYFDAVDLDGDNDLDLILGETEDSSLLYYLNDGNGQFSSQQLLQQTNLTTLHRFQFMDFDQDGILDIVLSGGGVHLAKGIAALQFEDAEMITPSFNAVSDFDVSDHDADGDNDIAISYSLGDEVTWLENEGAGVYSEQLLNQLIDWPLDVETGDLNGDGLEDIVFIGFLDQTIGWFENLGSGSFGPKIVIDQNWGNLTDLSLGDADQDGDLDICIASSSSQGSRIFENNGNGTFIDHSDISPTNAVFAFVEFVDLNGDSFPDLLASSTSSDYDFLIGDGTLGFETIHDFLPQSGGSEGHISTDLNSDGFADIIFYNLNGIHSIMGTGPGTFAEPELVVNPNIQVGSIELSDVNGDGIQDIVYDGFTAIKLALGVGNGTFSLPTSVISDGNRVGLLMVDLDADGLEDLVVTDFYEDKFSYYLNDSGDFGPEQLVDSSIDGPQSPHAADIDGDGDIDLFCVSESTDAVNLYKNTGALTFASPEEMPGLADGPSLVSTFDVDEDDDLDVISSSTLDNKILWNANLGNGDFASVENIATQSQRPSSVHFADMNNDGLEDLLVTSSFDSKLSLFINLPDTTFAAEYVISTHGRAPKSSSAIDIDLDGDHDVILSSSADGELSWYENLNGMGCTDPSACNYDAQATIDNGTCCFGVCGCIDPLAENFDPMADCDIGDCLYRIGGIVFFDANFNGEMDSTEFGVPDQEILNLNTGTLAFTNASGNYAFYDVVPNEQYTLDRIQDGSIFPLQTTANPLQAEIGVHVTDSMDFGVTDNGGSLTVFANVYPESAEYPCDTMQRHTISFKNYSSQIVDAVVALSYDTLFQGYVEIDPIDSVSSDGVIYMGFENINPLQLVYAEVGLHTPIADFLGEFLWVEVGVTTSDSLGQTASDTDWIETELTCAYDPNDKRVFPPGYSEEHFIANETNLEYVIRFQNTGNAPAQDVLIVDEIDENLDLSTFQLMTYSHEVTVNIFEEDRRIHFFFEDIQLPDSVNNEPESHGLVTFLIQPVEDLQLLTQIENTASIYFDNNPPIVTNTTWSTIYDCSLFQVDFSQNGAVLEASEGDYYQWYLDGMPIDEANSQTLEVTESGVYQVEIMSGFPCSGLSQELTVIIDALAENQERFSAYPNPSTNLVILDLDGYQGEIHVELVDMNGRIARSDVQQVSGQMVFNRNGLPSGHYTLRISNKDFDQHLRLVFE